MQGLEVTVLLGFAVLVGTMLAPKLRVSAPLVLLALGLLLGFVPSLRDVQLPPETVLLLFLPVLLFWESLTTSLRSIRRDFRYFVPMSTLLVVASAFGVAWMASLLGMPWDAAFILGAAVAPPDATAVSAFSRLLPRRIFMRLKAESLTNDGTALVLYAIAVSIAAGGHVSPLSVTWQVLVSYAGGIAAGLAVGGVAFLVLRRMRDVITINVTMLLVPFAAYLLAESVGASGVLAVVVAGLFAASVLPRISTAAARRQAEAAWPLGTTVLNGALFVLIGIETVYVVSRTDGRQLGWLVLVTVAVWATLLAVRWLFQLATVPITMRLDPRVELPSIGQRNRSRLVNTMAGLRGAVSLAIAMSVPLTTAAGAPMPGRDDIVVVTAGVIVLGLVVQSPLLPVLVRWARYPADDGAERERELASRTITGAAMASLDQLALQHRVSDRIRDEVRQEGYAALELQNALAVARERAQDDGEQARLEQLVADGDDAAAGLQMLAESPDVDMLQRSPVLRHEEYVRLQLAVLERKREVLQQLQRDGTVDDLVARGIQSRLDVEEARLRGVEPLD